MPLVVSLCISMEAEMLIIRGSLDCLLKLFCVDTVASMCEGGYYAFYKTLQNLGGFHVSLQ